MEKKSILYYDAECNLCNTWLNLIRNFDKKKHIEYIPLQSEKGKTVKEMLNAKFSNPDTVVFKNDGNIYIRSEAVLKCLCDLGGFWRIAKIFRIIPLKIRDRIYDMIARNRYKLFGKTESCDLLP